MGCGLAHIPIASRAADPKAKADAGFTLVGGVMVGGTIVLMGTLGFWEARTLDGTGVEVCENGFRQWPPSPASPGVRWDDVTRIEVRYRRDTVPLKLGGPLVSETLQLFVVVCRDGREFIYDRTSIGPIRRLERQLREVAEAHSIPWVVGRKP